MVTGTQDGLVNVFSLASGRAEPSFTLIGHSQNVSALHALPDGTIISGSWDKYVIALCCPESRLTRALEDGAGVEEFPGAVRT